MIFGGTVSAKTKTWCKDWIVFAVSIAAFFFPVYVSWGSVVVLDPDRQFQFAEEYFQKGEYYRAIGEYERFIFFFPETRRVEAARYKIGMAYLKGERYEEAIMAFKRFLEEYPDSVYLVDAYLHMGEAYVQVRRYDEAIANLQDLIAIAADENVIDEAFYRCGWVYLEQGLLEQAKVSLSKISPRNREKYKVEHLLKELDKKTHLKRKDPLTAGILAILPGAGHLYCERRRDALVSFLVNSALMFAAYEAFDHDQNALGGILTLVEIGFYSGNIYSAVGSAHKYNRDQQGRFLRYLKEQARISLSLDRAQGDGLLVLSCRVPF